MGVEAAKSMDGWVERMGTALAPPADGPAPDRAGLAAALNALGPEALPAVVAAVCGAADLPEEGVHPEALELRGEVLRDYLQRARPETVAASAVALGSSHADGAVRCAALRLVAGLERPEDLEAVLELASTLEPWVLASPSVESAVARAVTRGIAAGEDLSLAGVAPSEALVAAAAEGVARSRDPRVLARLASLLGHGLDADRAVVSRIEQCARETGAEPDAWTLQSVRDLLRSGEPELRRVATAAAAALRDVDAVPRLVDLLSDPDPRVAQVAASSLRELGGADLGPDPNVWTEWFESERTWLRETWPEHVQALGSDDPVEARGALRGVLDHPLWRRTTAREIAPRLRRLDPGVAAVACGVLARLGCRSAVPSLVQLLDVAEPALRDSAAAALQRLTGRTLPPVAEAWAEALGGP